MDAVAVIEDQAARTTKLVRSVRADQLGLPTPCTQWDVRGLINHLCLFCHWCMRVATGEQFEPDYETDFIGDDPSGAYERWKEAMLEACTDPGLPDRTFYGAGNEYPGAVLVVLAIMDTVVHRWDLARAVGADPDIDPEVAAMLLEQLSPLIEDTMRAPSPDETGGSVLFGPAVEVADDGSPVDRLLAFLGRTP